MEKVLTHPAPHQRTRGGHGGIDCKYCYFPVTLANAGSALSHYHACCDSGVLGRFRQAPAHLYNDCACVVHWNRSRTSGNNCLK